MGPGGQDSAPGPALVAAAEPVLGSGALGGSPVPAVLRLQALLLPPEGGGWLLPSLSHRSEDPERAEVRTGSVC